MNQNDPKIDLQSLNKTDLYFILWYLRLRWLRYKAGQLHPRQILIPATLLQILIFILAAYSSQHFISTLAIGNLIVVGIALLPMTLPRAFKAHWIKA